MLSQWLQQLNGWYTVFECKAGFCLPEASYRIHVIASLAVFFAASGAISFSLLVFHILTRRTPSVRVRRVIRIGLAPWLLGAVAFAYGHFIEPRLLEVTHTLLLSKRLPAGKRLRIALVSDVHADGPTSVLAKLPEIIALEKPDLLLFTGDAVNSERGIPPFEKAFAAVAAPDGKFAVLGNHDLDDANAPEWLRAAGLVDASRSPIRLAGGEVILCGARFDRPGDALACLDEAGPGYRIVAYHSPDIVVNAAAHGADLVLAGHTHGGQIRIPYYGALITMSTFDKKYESGLYRVGEAALYVTRGIGQAKQGPSMRLFCRPELSIIDVVGEGDNAYIRASRNLGLNPETHQPYPSE